MKGIITMDLDAQFREGKITKMMVTLKATISGVTKLVNHSIILPHEVFPKLDGTSIVHFTLDEEGKHLLEHHKVLMGGGQSYEGHDCIFTDKSQKLKFRGWEIIVPEVVSEQAVKVWMWIMKDEKIGYEGVDIQKEIQDMIDEVNCGIGTAYQK